MRSIRPGLLWLVMLMLPLGWAGCSSGRGSGSTQTSSAAATLVSIEVTPAASKLAKGTAQHYSVTGIYSDATTQDLTHSVTWTSSDTGIATLSSSPDSMGLATGTGGGSTTITATYGGLSDSTTLTVTEATLVSIGVTPAASKLATGTPQHYSATGIYSDATTQDLTHSVTWTSSDTGVATISNTPDSLGLATGTGGGSTTITATYGGLSGSTPLTVTTANLEFIAVTPAAPSMAPGTTRQFIATGTYSDYTTQDLTTRVAWTTGKSTIAIISNTSGSNGLATGAGVGTTTITATSGSVSGSTMATTATLESIAATPAAPIIVKSTTQQFVAMGALSDGTTQDLTSSVTWTSGDRSLANISNASGSHGLATGAGIGATTITATYGSTLCSANLTVIEATLESISVDPSTSSLIAGATLQFTARGTYTDDATQDLTSSVTWSSSDIAVVTIDSNGLATSVGLSHAQNHGAVITATYGGVSGIALLLVD